MWVPVTWDLPGPEVLGAHLHNSSQSQKIPESGGVDTMELCTEKTVAVPAPPWGQCTDPSPDRTQVTASRHSANVIPTTYVMNCAQVARRADSPLFPPAHSLSSPKANGPGEEGTVHGAAEESSKAQGGRPYLGEASIGETKVTPKAPPVIIIPGPHCSIPQA